MKTGLVIGKFYPPHRGHKYLIETALKQVEHLTVIVCERVDQKLSGALRAEWLKEIHPGVEVLVVEDILKDDDSWAWAEYTKTFLGYIPDLIFTSEEYGERYAAFLGSSHVSVDKLRRAVPVSASQIRDNPLSCWEYLEPCVRAFFALRVCVLGAESTGTTTLARELANNYKTVWVPEFGRLYWEAKMYLSEASKWNTSEFIFIAEQQNCLEDSLAKHCNRILFCDTDALATCLWHERYLGFWSEKVEALCHGREYDLYLLTDADIPFVQDGTRDGEHIRLKMHERFIEELKRRNKRFLILSGKREKRMEKAVSACAQLLKTPKPW